MDYAALVSQNDHKALAQLPVCDTHGMMLCTDAGVSLALWALYHGHRELAHTLCNRCSQIDLFTAAAMNDTDTLRAYIAADPTCITTYSTDGFQALGLACFFGAVDSARICVSAGAPVNQCSHNSFAVAPLHSATAADAAALVEILLQAGADPNLRQAGGFTPLHGAAQHGNYLILSMLIQAGADISLRTDAGQSAADFMTADHDPRCRALLHPTAHEEQS